MGVEIVLRWGDTLLEVVHVERGGFAVDGTELVRAGQLFAPATGRVGAVAYELHTERRADTLASARNDLRLVPYLLTAAAVHVGLAMWALCTPPATPTSATTARITQHAHITAAPPPERAEGEEKTGHAGRGEASAMRGAAGATGAPRATPPQAHVAIANTGEEAQLSRADAIARARHAGILGSAKIASDAFASLVGHDKLTSGFDDHSAEAALSAGATPGGGFGAARTGFGNGGGGRDGSMIGLGTIGHASEGTSQGHGWGGIGRGSISPSWNATWQGGDYAIVTHRHVGYTGSIVDLCPAKYRDRCKVNGALDPAIVRRYVRRNNQKLAYCYEKLMLADPKIADQVVFLSFAINGDGSVASPTVFPDPLGTCTSEVIAGIAFPAGATQVDYVIAFKPRR